MGGDCSPAAPPSGDPSAAAPPVGERPIHARTSGTLVGHRAVHDWREGMNGPFIAPPPRFPSRMITLRNHSSPTEPTRQHAHELQATNATPTPLRSVFEAAFVTLSE
ncbi:hypothetical protein GCM10017786_25610 [Amycolatopsis deserti]|uniref:Uncharacterized protein n=1 Tax=Amycolatopsis deserti TaxID=185696 RepID=A0ABQ3IQW5_9PSEU|nr:hypothetical protein GCM10017786_25610 [Amycolatopsis deserti]